LAVHDILVRKNITYLFKHVTLQANKHIVDMSMFHAGRSVNTWTCTLCIQRIQWM